MQDNHPKPPDNGKKALTILYIDIFGHFPVTGQYVFCLTFYLVYFI